MPFTAPAHDCPLCPRLAGFREENRTLYPGYYNAPVPAFGALDAALLVVGLAPGLKGANQTGRPFTGDYAGRVLYSALRKAGFAHGEYDPAKVADADHAGDGLRLAGCRITNAVRCLPPFNKPEQAEIRQCNGFLKAEITAMKQLRVILTLGQIAHKAVLAAFGRKQSAHAFGHGNIHGLQLDGRDIWLYNSYHSSRYNINTGALTQAMFDNIVAQVRAQLEA